MRKVTLKQAYETGLKLKVDFNAVPVDVWMQGMQVEMEHANVTHGSLLTTGRIAKAHIDEFVDYYQRLAKMEKRLRHT
jgi:hypothetical protein